MCSWDDQANVGSVVRVRFSTCGGDSQAWMLLPKVNRISCCVNVCYVFPIISKKHVAFLAAKLKKA